MLPKINRLTKKKDFETVFRGGKSLKNDALIFKTLKNHLLHSRFGFVVSKKVSNKATVRNNVKRRLGSAIGGILKNVKEPCDVVIIALPAVTKKEFLELQVSVSEALKGLKII